MQAALYRPHIECLLNAVKALLKYLSFKLLI